MSGAEYRQDARAVQVAVHEAGSAPGRTASAQAPLSGTGSDARAARLPGTPAGLALPPFSGNGVARSFARALSRHPARA